jgi:hypothetical protein
MGFIEVVGINDILFVAHKEGGEGCMLFFRVFWPICGISDNRYCTVPRTVIRILK